MPRRVATPEERRPEPSRRDRSQRQDALKIAKVSHDAENEIVILAACVVDPPTRARLTKALPADGFFAKGHPAAWAALCEIERRGLQYDPATVRQLSSGAADAGYLDMLAAQRPAVPPNLAHHVETFLWDRRRIEAARGPVASLVEALQDPATEPEQLRQLARSVGRSFDGSGALRYLRDPGAVTAAAKARLAQRRTRFADGHVCYPYGLPGLDLYEDGRPRLIPGREPQQMTLVVGVSGNGKTTVTNQIVLANANAGERTLHGAWEQDGETNLQMLAGYSLAIPRTRLWTGDLSDDEERSIGVEMDRLGGGDRPLVRFFELPFDRRRGEVDRRARSLNDVNLDVIHEHVEAAGCSLAIFDLVAKAIVESKPEEERRALDRLLGIAKETSSHFIALHHLNKGDVDKRPDKAPTRDAIKGGTHWIDVFDTIFGVHIPGVWKDVPKDTLEVRVLKQRYGEWPLAVELRYDAATGIVSGGKEIPVEHPEERRSGDGWTDDFLGAGDAREPERPKRGRGRR